MALVGNIESLKRVYDPKATRASLHVPINTPNLEIRIVVLQPGQRPPYHRHHPEMDEGYLIFQGRGLMTIDGETFEVRAGDMLLGKRAGFHTMENTGDEDLIEFNFRGGRMPSGNIPFEGNDAVEVPMGIEHVDESLEAGKKYIVGNLFDGTRRDAPRNEKEVGIPGVFTTPHLELFAFTRNTGDGNQVHRHQTEMGEAAFFVRGEGRMRFSIDGEEVEAGAGDLIHIPGGAWHFVERVKEGELIVLNIRGGKLPSVIEWQD